MQSFVFRVTRNVNGKRVIRRTYSGRYRLDGDHRATTVSLGTSDKRVAVKRLNDLVARLDREAVGVGVPRVLADLMATPWEKHVDRFQSGLRSLRRDEKYVVIVGARLRKVALGAGWSRLAHVTRASFETWRSSVVLSGKTLNDYLALLGEFWKSFGPDVGPFPLSSVRRVSTKSRDVFRRAYTDEELSALFKHAGNYRLPLLFASVTGCRRAEVIQLRWGDVRLDGDEPLIVLRATTTKNGRRASFPLYGGVSDEFAKERPEHVVDSQLVFPQGLPSMAFLRGIFRKAGITAVDSMGRRLVLHSTRYSFCTLLHRWGWPEARIMQGMRVVDRKLIDRTYLDSDLLHRRVVEGVVPWFGRSLRRSLDLHLNTIQNTNMKGDVMSTKQRLDLLFAEISQVLAESLEMGAVGREQHAVSSRKQQKLQAGGAECGAFDPDLFQLIELWPTLSPRKRRAVLALVRPLKVRSK